MRVEITFSKREGGFLSFKFCKITIMHKCVVLIQERINWRTVQEDSVVEMLAYMFTANLKFLGQLSKCFCSEEISSLPCKNHKKASLSIIWWENLNCC